MDEAAARRWLTDELAVSRETRDRLEAFVTLLRAENDRQNLVSAASLDAVWSRHIVDSAQLWRLAHDAESWLDLGSGPGLPGLVIALLTDAPVTLVESRRLRTDWLSYVVGHLRLGHVRILAARLETVEPFAVDAITARAFAPLPRLLALAHRFSTEKTRWVLPKGRSAAEELASVASAWHGDFHMEPSVTDPDSAIIVAQGVRPKAARR